MPTRSDLHPGQVPWPWTGRCPHDQISTLDKSPSHRQVGAHTIRPPPWTSPPATDRWMPIQSDLHPGQVPQPRTGGYPHDQTSTLDRSPSHQVQNGQNMSRVRCDRGQAAAGLGHDPWRPQRGLAWHPWRRKDTYRGVSGSSPGCGN